MKKKLTKEENQELESLIQDINTAIITVSKGKAWIEIDEKNETVKLSALNDDPEIVEHAKNIQLMFNEAVENKKFNTKAVQKALDYFGWDLYLIEDDEGVSFRGDDKFLLVQISYYMGAVNNKQYAEMYRTALEDKQKVFI